MKLRLAPLAAILTLAPAAPVVLVPAVHAAPAQKSPLNGKRHPLKGVVTAVDSGLSALRVKHEEIPGVMRAMTMLFKVDAATLKAVKPGDAITGLMTREEGEWRLYDVKVVTAAKK
jgi:Cu/Ag efflux protein CusF